MYTFNFACLRIILLFISSILVWALPGAIPETDGLSESYSGKSFDENVALIFKYLSVSGIENDELAEVHQASFTQGACQYLSSEYPTKNVLIYHNQSSIFNGVNSVHRSIELPFYSKNKTYEVDIFDSGTFTLAGDSGYHNWAFCGNWSHNGALVKFDPLTDSSHLYYVQDTAWAPSPAALGGGYISSPGTDSGISRVKIKPRAEYFSGPTWDPDVGMYWVAYKGEGMVESSVTWVTSISDALVADAEVSLVDPILGVVLLAAIAVVAGLFSAGFANLFHEHSRESAYTQSTIYQQFSATPYKNVIVYHDQGSTWNFNNWIHMHYELPLGFAGKTQGYEIYVFDSGNFTLAGDGGWINWAFIGNWIRDPPDSNFVTFNQIPCPQVAAAMVEARSEAKKPLRRRRPFPPQVPSRENHETRDGYYFVNCVNPENTLSLGIAYYNDMIPGGGNVGQLPDDFVDVLYNHAGMKTWQGQGDATFVNRKTPFLWSFLHQGGKDYPLVVGAAETPFEQFWVYKDAGEMLYSTGNLTCNSLYYTF